MALGAIAKSVGGALVKKKAKQVATDKLMGRGKKKDSGIVKSKTNKEIIGNMMGRKIGGEKTTDIPASKQTIDVTPLGSDSLVKPSGGSGDIKIVQDISVAVSAIAESMKSGLILKEKAAKKARLNAEKAKRAAQETKLEKPDDKDDKPKGPQFKVPKIGLLDGIFGFITNFLFGALIMKLIDFANSPLVKGILTVVAAVGKAILDTVGFLFNAFTSLVDFGYKLVSGAERIVGKIFGEEGAKKFATFMENIKPLLNAFLVWKIIGKKIFTAIISKIRNAFKLVKNIFKTAGKVFAKLFPNVAKGIGKVGSKILSAGKGLVSKGIAKVGGFAAKIFGKAAGVISPAFKSAKPFLSKFFGKIPIVGPLVITIVSLLSGEPATQAIFKGLGGAVGGLLGSFIPIPILGTLIGETIGVFVGDLLYEGLFNGGIGAAVQKIKDTLMTLFKGGKMVADWVGGGIKAFVNNVLKTDPIKVKEGFGVRSTLTKGIKLFGLYNFFEGLGFTGGKDGQVDKFPNILNILNPLKFYPLLFKSFFGKRDETSDVNASGSGTATVSDEDDTITTTISGSIGSQETFGGKGGSTYENTSDNVNTIEGRISRSQQNKAGKDAEAVATETTYERGEGNEVIVPVPVVQVKEIRTNTRGSGARGGKKDSIDQSVLSMYAGK